MSFEASVLRDERWVETPPAQAWLHSPEFCDRAQKVGEFIRFDTCLPPALLASRLA